MLFFLVLSPSTLSAAWLFPDKNLDIENDKLHLSDRWDAILIEAKAVATYSAQGGTAKLPKYSTTILTNHKLEFDLNKYKDKLGAVKAFILLASIVVSFFILFA